MYERMITRFLVRAFQYLHNNAHRDSRVVVVVVVSLIHLPVLLLCHILPPPPTLRINDRFRIGASRGPTEHRRKLQSFCALLCCAAEHIEEP